MIREFEARAEGAHTEAERIATHARAANSRAAWLRDYLLKNLELLGVQRIETATTVVVIRKSPPGPGAAKPRWRSGCPFVSVV